MKSDFIIALTQLAAERSLPRETVLSAIEDGLISAFKRDTITEGHNISVKLDPGSGEISVDIIKLVVDRVVDPLQEILLADAQHISPEAHVGSHIRTQNIPNSAGRIAAQTARQVVLQRLREAERELLLSEYSDKIGEIFTINIQRVEPRQLIVDLGRAEAIVPASQQVTNERYRPGHKMKVVLQAIDHSPRGPELIVSRNDVTLLRRLFEMEVPEIYNGTVEIMGIARESGSRSKIAVRARQDGVDAVGSCVGLRGVRIQTVVNELQGEKIDVLEWSKDPSRYIANALSPSQVMRVQLSPESDRAIAVVPERQLSLAIGKEGQNARLAAKLTGWKVDIQSNIETSVSRTPQTTKIELPKSEPQPVYDINEIVEALAKLVEVEEPNNLVTDSLAPTYDEVSTDVNNEPTREYAETNIADSIDQLVEAVEASETPEPVETASVEELLAIELHEETAPVDEGESVDTAEEASSLHDLPEDVWSVRRAARAESEPGVIRFAEDIVDLRGGVTARRSRHTPTNQANSQRGRKKRTKASRRRR